ncbi:G-type lectin S-receptor-like serine/threonine-protein kinase [Actinidia chinensis var. chinensis]|uniref:non-specific serine/threonine protein kinase n=1 Tax=Actinidia chinensis var. chinensis TaxID=1590841 RepID=A0A2R6QWW6_ACTCC|nr:G-type lectin S-receptor-like serine/threonine-protein kinase [Actinidia chinensis var. chinensis]
MGFFSPGSSPNRYFGIWYTNVASGTVVWVANRAIPPTNTSGVLKVVSPGILVLHNSTNHVIWSSNTSKSASNPMAQLLDTGNLVMRDGSDSDQENFLSQSFDYQGETFLPGMKFGKDFRTGLNRYWSSWKSVDDPSLGDYTNRFDTNGYPQILLGVDEVYYEYELVNSSVVSRMELSPGGMIQRFTWINRTQGWVLYLTTQMDNCDRYALCGPYGSCNIDNSPACWCLKGFEPKAPGEWNVTDWSDGCARRTPLEEMETGFLDTPNCSCTAYTSLDIRGGGSGCLLWFGDLIDIRQCSENGQDLYVRMAGSELGMINLNPEKECTDEKNGQDIDLPLFDFLTIAKATNFFMVNNKLGEGGFGPANKGMLEKGLQIAVKRLSKSSKQGLDEFKNEVLCIAKLQHRNLVKLLGCCIEEEQMLIYEYLPNKSLDSFIFDYDMNPKISDFGLARIFGGNETSANTTRVVGTCLLCVQQSPEDRPSMSTVVPMLCSDMSLPQPKQPGFFIERKFLKADSIWSKGESHSANLLTLSYLGPR